MYQEYKSYLQNQKYKMEYEFLSPNCGLKVSSICLGTMTMKKKGKMVSFVVVFQCKPFGLDSRWRVFFGMQPSSSTWENEIISLQHLTGWPVSVNEPEFLQSDLGGVDNWNTREGPGADPGF